MSNPTCFRSATKTRCSDRTASLSQRRFRVLRARPGQSTSPSHRSGGGIAAAAHSRDVLLYDVPGASARCIFLYSVPGLRPRRSWPISRAARRHCRRSNPTCFRSLCIYCVVGINCDNRHDHVAHLITWLTLEGALSRRTTAASRAPGRTAS